MKVEWDINQKNLENYEVIIWIDDQVAVRSSGKATKKESMQYIWGFIEGATYARK